MRGHRPAAGPGGLSRADGGRRRALRTIGVALAVGVALTVEFAGIVGDGLWRHAEAAETVPDAAIATIVGVGSAAARDVHALALDSADLSLERIGPAIVEALAARGIAVDPAAPVRLSWTLRRERSAPARSGIGVAGTVGSNSRARLRLEVPLPEEDAPTAPGTPIQLWMAAGAPGEPPVWQASLTVRAPDPEPADLIVRMVRTLLARWGETVRATVTLE